MSQISSILLAGDCGPSHGPADGFPIESYTERVLPVLKQADMRFVNCMRTYSTRGIQADHAPQVCQPVEMADIYSHGLFDGVNMANNHTYDAGPDALVDTRALFLSRGIQTTGAGRDGYLTDDACPNLAALFVLTPFAVLNICPFTVASHQKSS